MWELYQQLGTFTLVAKKMHRSPDTVSRHIQKYETALAITKANRNGEGFTPVEELQVDVFCNGICAVYKKILDEKYDIDPGDAADALYEMMPESLKHYWWK